MTAVTPAPVPTAKSRFDVSLARIDRMRSPATALSASVIRSMPWRNSASPPKSVISRMTTSRSPDSCSTASRIGIGGAR